MNNFLHTIIPVFSTTCRTKTANNPVHMKCNKKRILFAQMKITLEITARSLPRMHGL